MTIIIGALLDDGRHIIVGDGNIATENGGRRSSSYVKVRRIDGMYKKRKALVGVAGFPADLIVYEDVMHKYLNSPEPKFNDLFYKLTERYRDVGYKHDSMGVLWLPDMHEVMHLVSVDGNCFPRMIDDCNFHAEGSGGTEARAALLGLAWKARGAQSPHSEQSWPDFLKEWKPSYDDVMIAYSVACQMDTYCGGVMTVLSL